MIERLLVVAAIVALSALAGRWWQARQERVVRRRHAGDERASRALLFTTPQCRTCPQVRANLAIVAAGHDGFAVTEIDASTDLDVARRHGVLRAPTVVLLGTDGSEVARAAGIVSAAAIRAAAGLPAPQPEVA